MSTLKAILICFLVFLKSSIPHALRVNLVCFFARLFVCMYLRISILLEAFQLSKKVPGLFLVLCLVFFVVCVVCFVLFSVRISWSEI